MRDTIKLLNIEFKGKNDQENDSCFGMSRIRSSNSIEISLSVDSINRNKKPTSHNASCNDWLLSASCVRAFCVSTSIDLFLESDDLYLKLLSILSVDGGKEKNLINCIFDYK